MEEFNLVDIKEAESRLDEMFNIAFQFQPINDTNSPMRDWVSIKFALNKLAAYAELREAAEELRKASKEVCEKGDSDSVNKFMDIEAKLYSALDKLEG